MKRFALLLLLSACLLLTACQVRKTEEEKLRDIAFTVLDHEDIPQEFLTQIEKKKEGQMKLSYADKGYLYGARGYGVQETSGYSVAVEKCYETEYEIQIETSLLGPGKEEKILKKKTYPYVVIKMEYTDKQIDFK